MMNAVVPSRPQGNDHAVPGKGQPCEQRIAAMREHSSAMPTVDVSTCPYRDAGPRVPTWIGESLGSQRPLRPQTAAAKLAHDQETRRVRDSWMKEPDAPARPSRAQPWRRKRRRVCDRRLGGTRGGDRCLGLTPSFSSYQRYSGGASHAHNYQLRDASLDRLDGS